MNSPGATWLCLAAAACGLAMLPIAHSASEAPSVTLLEQGGRIQITGEAAAAAPYERGFRLRVAPPEAAPILAASDLERAGRVAIDRTKVVVEAFGENTGA